MATYVPTYLYSPNLWGERPRSQYLPSLNVTRPEGRGAAALLGAYNVMPYLGAAGAQYVGRWAGLNADVMRQMAGDRGHDLYRAFQAAKDFVPAPQRFALGTSGLEAARGITGIGRLANWLGSGTTGFGPSAMNDYLNAVTGMLESGGWGRKAPTTFDEWRDFERRRQLALSLTPGEEVPEELVGLVQQALMPELLATPVSFARAPRVASLGNWWR